LYHVIARGIERRKIFLDSEDYKDFISRLKACLEKTQSRCLAWCLLPNHFHLLILRGRRPLSELMRSLMTGYAVNFNRRHKRAGHLFQNRYKSILCDKDPYLLELTAYIHLNPLRAKIIRNMKGLKKYKWCGHADLMGEETDGLIDRGYILSYWSTDKNNAKKEYAAFLREKVGKFKGGEYSGGGLLKSMGGLAEVMVMRKNKEREMYDDRILGGGEFVEGILKRRDKKVEVRISTRDDILKEAAKIAGISEKEIFIPSHKHKAAIGRAVYCYIAKGKLGVTGTELMKELKITSGGISHLVEKGRKIMEEQVS